MTVKELKQMLKESNTLERGVLSTLKRKADLIEYIEENLQGSANGASSEPQTATHSADSTETTTVPNNKVEPKPRVEQNSQDTANGASSERPVESSPPVVDSPSAAAATTAPKKKPRGMPSLNVVSKDDMYEHVYNLFPPLRDENCTGLGDEDVRQLYHPMVRGANSSDMDIITVGTASCSPGITRGVSCTALRLHWQRRYMPSDGNNVEHTSFLGGTWLFDAGECTQLQAQRTNRIRPGKVNKIFLTHAHGDHTFGLPGIMCLMGQDRDRESPPLDIYGPEGLRMWLRVAIRYSVSRIVPPYRVHEIMKVPMAPEWRYNKRSNRYYNSLHKDHSGWGNKKGLAGEDPESWISQANQMPLEPSMKFGEIEGGRDIYPEYDHPMSYNGAPVWQIENEDDVKVYAAPMSHGVPCLGYVVEEQSRPGRLRNEYVEPIVRRNIKAMKESGFRVPMKAMAVIKNLPAGSSFTFPDGTVVTQEEAVEPPRSGRKVVICGDTSDASSLTNLAMDADVVVHEATNAYLSFLDKDSQDLRSVTKDSMTHGHSTPQMAASFAKKVNAKQLLLNHFSPRYKGDPAVDSISIMTRLEHQARKAGGFDETQVASAWDFMLLPIPQK